MKTIPEIHTEIATLEKECTEIKDWPEIKAMTDTDKQWAKIEKEKDKRRKRISMRRDAIKYLETNPRPEFIQQQKEEAQHKIDVYEKRIVDWKEMYSDEVEKMKNPREYYYKHVAKGEDKLLSEARKQLSNINYILS